MVEFPIFRVSGASPASPIVLCCMHIVKLSGSFYTPAVCFNAPLRLIGVSKVNSPLGPVHFTVKFIISFYVPGNLVLTDSIGKHVMGICNTEVVALPGYTISCWSTSEPMTSLHCLLRLVIKSNPSRLLKPSTSPHPCGAIFQSLLLFCYVSYHSPPSRPCFHMVPSAASEWRFAGIVWDQPPSYL